MSLTTRPSPSRPSAPLLLAATVALLLAGCGAGPTTSPEPAAPATPAAPSVVAAPTPRDSQVEALAVLHAWDARRLQAWRAGDAAALRSLYVPGSSSARADLHLLREYADRGLVLQDLRTQVFAVSVLARSPVRLRLRVVDRVAGGTAVRARRAVALPATAPVVRVVDLRRTGPSAPWRVVETTRPG